MIKFKRTTIFLLIVSSFLIFAQENEEYYTKRMKIEALRYNIEELMKQRDFLVREIIVIKSIKKSSKAEREIVRIDEEANKIRKQIEVLK
jgi:hypothetical protein